MRRIFLIIIVGFMAGCSTSAKLTETEAVSEDFGTVAGCPTNYELTIKAELSKRLKDPESGQFKFGKCEKGKVFFGLVNGGTKFGYVVPVLLNAKNSFGGYTGFSLYYFLFRSGVYHWRLALPEDPIPADMQ
ncbi:MAG: hypothetical protein R3A80_03830 [Bdellovibrionota bacterium]